MNPQIYAGLTPFKQSCFLNRTQEPIIAIVCRVTGVTKIEIESPSRVQRLNYTRILLSYFLRKRTRLSFKSIGVLQGDRHYSTIMNHLNAYQDLYDTDKVFRRTSKEIAKNITELGDKSK